MPYLDAARPSTLRGARTSTPEGSRLYRRALGRPRSTLATAIGTLVAAVALLTPGTSSAATPSSAAAAAKPVTVTVWTWGGENSLWAAAQKNIDKQTGQHIIINVRDIVSTSYNTVLTTGMDAGTGPDLFKDRTGSMMQQFAAAKLIAPLNGRVSLSHFGSAPISTVTYKGKVYGVPQVTEQMVAFYNKAIFTKLHLSVPTTWEQFMSELSTIKAAGTTPLYMMGTQQWLVALDFDEVAATIVGGVNAAKIVGRDANFTSKPYVQALSDFQHMGQYLEPDFQAIGAAGNEQEIAFAEGHAAVILDGLFDYTTIAQAKPKFKIGEFLIPPQSPGQTATLDWYPNASYALNSKISNPKERAAALEVLRYAASPSFGQVMVNTDQETDAMNGIKVPASDPLLRQAYDLYKTKALHPLLGIDSAMDTPPINTKDIGIFQAEQNVLVQLLQGKLTPEATAQQIQKATAWYFKAKA